MPFHYGDAPAGNPVTGDDDRAYMETRWQKLLPASVRIVVEASIVTVTDTQQMALSIATAWRYDIGEDRIECLFVFPDHIEHFLATGQWTVIGEPTPAETPYVR